MATRILEKQSSKERHFLKQICPFIVKRVQLSKYKVIDVDDGFEEVGASSA